MAPLSRMVYSLLQSPLEMGYALGTAPEPHFLAKIVSALPADSTLSARNSHLERDSVADSEVAHIWPNCNDNARGLMTKG